ncbi:3577_t:CDS:2 [Gigaspora rosea]|nr:3577_t:CDS:2 [Gigaspora rosea]
MKKLKDEYDDPEEESNNRWYPVTPICTPVRPGGSWRKKRRKIIEMKSKEARNENTTSTDEKTGRNGWYEEEEFEVYLAITPNEIDSQEAGAMPQDPTTTQSNSIEDQANATRRPILDEGFARRMEYQDLIMDVVMESGMGYNWYSNDWEFGGDRPNANPANRSKKEAQNAWWSKKP